MALLLKSHRLMNGVNQLYFWWVIHYQLNWIEILVTFKPIESTRGQSLVNSGRKIPPLLLRDRAADPEAQTSPSRHHSWGGYGQIPWYCSIRKTWMVQKPLSTVAQSSKDYWTQQEDQEIGQKDQEGSLGQLGLRQQMVDLGQWLRDYRFKYLMLDWIFENVFQSILL